MLSEKIVARWRFYFTEGDVGSDVYSDEEDKRIENYLQSGLPEILKLPGGTMDVYVNLALVKCVSRQIVDLSEQPEQAPSAS
jgi:hypothetical protein